jgi:hypothetical protein
MNGLASGSFVALDHEYPSWLELQFYGGRQRRADQHHVRAARSPDGQPHLQDEPCGLRVTVGAGTTAQTTPFTQTFIVNATIQVSADSQSGKSGTYNFQSWSDGGALDHVISAPSTATTYTAVYRKK